MDHIKYIDKTNKVGACYHSGVDCNSSLEHKNTHTSHSNLQSDECQAGCGLSPASVDEAAVSSSSSAAVHIIASRRVLR